ncbi:MAG: DUF4062 domain-containing protein [Desulfobacterales bacterium]
MLASKKDHTSADSKTYPLYNVFVSSTYLDNKKRRKTVQEAISMAEMVWHGLKILSTSKRPTVEECQHHADEANVFGGFIARRYGWISEGSDISITEMGYDAVWSTAFMSRSI